MNNNLIERLHGTRRDGDKVVRGLKTEETPIVSMQDIYHNYIRPHQALEGRAPAQKAGLGIEDQNRWLGPIKKSLEMKHRPEVDNPI